MSAEERPPVPVWIFTGFLGAGKTTLLNHVLKTAGERRRLACIENEYAAEFGLESGLIATAPGSGPAADSEGVKEVVEFRELVGGCVCCSVRPSLISALHELADAGAFDGVIVETTGLANPQPVANVFFAPDTGLTAKFTLMGVVTVVDAGRIQAQLADAKPDGVANEAHAQLVMADMVVLNKVDTVTVDGLAAARAAVEAVVRPGTRITNTSFSMVDDVDSLLSGDSCRFDLAAVTTAMPEFLAAKHHLHDTSITSLAATIVPPLVEATLRAALDALLTGTTPAAKEVLRLKAEVLLSHDVDTRYVLQGVGAGYVLTATGSWAAGSGFTQLATRMVVIGRGLKLEALEALVASAAVAPDSDDTPCPAPVPATADGGGGSKEAAAEPT